MTIQGKAKSMYSKKRDFRCTVLLHNDDGDGWRYIFFSLLIQQRRLCEFFPVVSLHLSILPSPQQFFFLPTLFRSSLPLASDLSSIVTSRWFHSIEYIIFSPALCTTSNQIMSCLPNEIIRVRCHITFLHT